MAAADYRSTLQLAEFLAALEKCHETDDAVRDAVERVAEAVDAEVAVALGREIVFAIGFGRNNPSHDDLRALADARIGTLDVPGVGAVFAVAAPVEDSSVQWLVVGRTIEAFLPEELALVEGMTRALGIHLRQIASLEAERRHGRENARLVGLLEDRQRLLERLSSTQRTLSRRAPLPDVLDAIADGAAVLLDVEVVGLRLLDLDDPDQLVTVATAGISPKEMLAIRRCPTRAGIGGRAFCEERLVVVDDYGNAPDALAEFASSGLRVGMAAPVHEDGNVVGVLVVGCYDRTVPFGPHEQEAFLAFAENASLALSDVKMVETLQRSFRDPLTGLPNRSLFVDRLDSALASALADRSPVAVIVVALADFSSVNHDLGYASGDRVLQAAAAQIEESALGSDVVARLAGDEFAVLLRSADVGAAMGVAERIREGLGRLTADGRRVPLRARIGMAMSETACEDPEEILRAADRSARDAGRILAPTA